MDLTIKKIVTFALSFITLFYVGTTSANDLIKPESNDISIGIQPWLGYGQWYVAKEKGFLAQNGLTNVTMTNFVEDKDINAALASKQIDGANVATHTAMSMVAAGIPVKIVLLLDTSKTSDAILVNPNIKTLAELKGQSIAYEEGTTSDILLRNALDKAGLKWDEINPVPMPAASAGSALISKRVAAAVTYEPYITVARSNDATIHVLYDGTQAPGIISDAFVVRNEVIEKNPGKVYALIKSWNDAVRYYREHTQEGRAIIAKGVGESPDEITTAFNGVEYLSVANNHDLLHAAFKQTTFAQILKAATSADMIMQPITYEQVIDSHFVDDLSK
ncbi:ABC transporter substrate-binding protein [Orbaceae bacterium ESL0727]|nr:ABC transporter substrate-binding protein [Orbaceae bacterium ESL0727]